MSTPHAVEYDRRKDEKGFCRHVLETFSGKQGRKVAFGIWLFWVATGLLAKAFITNQQWFYCMIIAALLIGFGTVVDSVVAKLGDAVVAVFTDKLTRVKSTLTVTQTSEVKTDAPAA